MIIYKITNQVNNKVYVGQTTRTLKLRLSEQFCRPNKHLKRAFKKYGRKNFTGETIEECISFEELDLREQYWISFYNSTNRQKGYNFEGGGCGKRKIANKKIVKNPNKIIGRSRVSVDQIDPKTLTIINTYESVSAAAKALKIYPSYITATCQMQQIYTAGFAWKFSNMNFDLWKVKYLFLLENKKETRYKKEQKLKIKLSLKPIYFKKTSLGDIVEVLYYKQFNNLDKEAKSVINRNCRGSLISVSGFTWSRDYAIQ